MQRVTAVSLQKRARYEQDARSHARSKHVELSEDRAHLLDTKALIVQMLSEERHAMVQG